MRHLAMLLGGLACLAVACSLATLGGAGLVPGRPGQFPHAVHLGADVGFTCLDCHETAESAAQAGMPTFEVCSLCHFGALEGADLEGVDGQEAAGEPGGAGAGELDPILARFVLEGENPTWTKVTGLSVACDFSHAVHAQAGVACTECHPRLEESAAVDGSLHVDMAACIDCHEQRGVQDGGCSGCHPGVDASWKPPTHDGSWELIHGQVWRSAAGSSPAMDCELCHGDDHPEQSCESCHQMVQPRDHTPFFKNAGHGMLALFDRGRCLACHQEDSCLECHLSVRPRNHGAGFGAPRNQHCLGCHFESRQMEACRVCHFDGAPSHALAPTPPPTVAAHATTTACLTCHLTVKPPRHPYTGDGNYCRRCHQ